MGRVNACSYAAKGIALGILGSVAVLVYLFRFAGYSTGVFAIHAMMLALVVVGTRLSFRVIGEAAGALLLRELRNNARSDYQTVGFLDDDLSKTHKKMFGLPVLGDIDRLEA